MRLLTLVYQTVFRTHVVCNLVEPSNVNVKMVMSTMLPENIVSVSSNIYALKVHYMYSESIGETEWKLCKFHKQITEGQIQMQWCIIVHYNRGKIFYLFFFYYSWLTSIFLVMALLWKETQFMFNLKEKGVVCFICGHQFLRIIFVWTSINEKCFS